MNTAPTLAQAPAAARGAPAKRSRAWAFGPGLVFALGSIGPNDLISNAAMGATYGYQLLWSLVVIYVARYFILEASARYVLVTGESIVQGYSRMGRWVVWLLFGSIFLKRHLSNLFMILLLGGSTHLLAPLPTSWSSAIWSLVWAGSAFALMFAGGYRAVERWSRPLLILLGGSLAAAAFLAQPSAAGIARGLLLPSAPEQQGFYRFTLLLMALAGTGAGAVSNLKYPTYVHEKGWRSLAHLREQRSDLMLSIAGMAALSLLIQVAAAATLFGRGVEVRSTEDLVPLFAQVLGEPGRIVLALGMWGAVFTTFLGSNTGYSLMCADMYRNCLRREGAGLTADRHATASADPSFRWFLAWFCLSPLYVLFTAWEPFVLAIFTSALFVILMPVIVVVLWKLTNDRRLLGEHVNRPLTNAALAVVFLVSLYLTARNALDLAADLGF